MILAPLAGMILNLMDASTETECSEQNDVVGVFASMDCPDTVLCGFQCLLEYNWVSSLSLSLSNSKILYIPYEVNSYLILLMSMSSKFVFVYILVLPKQFIVLVLGTRKSCAFVLNLLPVWTW